MINGAALESAIGRPYNGYYPRIWDKAAALVHSMVGNHPFVDGNKRTALLLTNMFLLESGYRLRPEAVEESEEFLITVAAGECSLADMKGWFKARIIDRKP